MSGIFGIFCRTGLPAEPGALRCAHDVFAQWFDDDRGIWCEQNVGLGHTMLWNTPESAREHLPAVDGAVGRRLILTADVRLDNRAELADLLEINAPIDSITDSQLLLAAYRKWNEDSPEYLLGDFAYVIWDEQRRQLFCARDHIGIKQLYYSLTDELFVFASDISALKAINVVSASLSEEAIAIYLQSSRYIHQSKTFYESINKLKPASILLVSGDTIGGRTYWRAEDSPPIRLDTFQDYVQHLRQLLDSAVKARLRTAYPVTSHLSGGLDSSAITVLAARALASEGKVPRVFNWSYMPSSDAQPDCMEWSHAKKVVAQEGLSIEHVALNAEYVKEVYLGADISLYEDNLYWEEARERALSANQGVRTILSGWGGDELVSYGSNSYYSGLIRRGKFLRVLQLIYSNGRHKNLTLVQMLKKYGRSILYVVFNRWMNGLYKIEKDNSVFNVLNPEFNSAVRSSAPPALTFQYAPHGEQLELFNHGHLQSRMEIWGASALRDAVEYSYPLLDKRIVEFALGVSEELFEPRKGYSRYLFRSAVSAFLPHEVAWAPKYSSPRHFEMRKRLWLEVSGLLLREDLGLFDNHNQFIDVELLYRIIEKIVALDSTDFDAIENISVVGPAIAIAALGKL